MEVVLDSGRLRKLKSLLLTYLFAVNAAADCVRPPSVPDDIDLSEESMLVDQYTEGVQLSLICVSGFIRESGTGITTCKNGEWTPSDLTCKRKDCGPPDPQPHMTFDLSQGTLFGATIRAFCDKGYSLFGVAHIHCYDLGWFGRATCNVVVCKSPPEVANSVRSWNGGDIPKYGEIIHYSCEEGYALIGNSIITCDEHGGYTPRPPICETIPTEAKIPTTMTSSIPSTSKAETTSTVSSTTSHRNKFATTQAASTVSLSQEADSGSWKAFEETVTSSTSSFRVSAPLIISLGAVSLVTILLMVFLYILHQKKKGNFPVHVEPIL
ncbi:complement decay-accelerating factor isoform X3 [Oryzias melastigma]|uniref:complement decay-accelerating factor isoform X3 n=1 Tax=Oryzias melastigma TaxID=30732 RepID=UPI000CF8348F|nr:complement decay-accelerating factor isoform X3 [Oryzias melastigma]